MAKWSEKRWGPNSETVLRQQAIERERAAARIAEEAKRSPVLFKYCAKFESTSYYFAAPDDWEANRKALEFFKQRLATSFGLPLVERFGIVTPPQPVWNSLAPALRPR